MRHFKAEWAYSFSSNLSLEEVSDIFNSTNVWQWQERESYIYGYYLNTRPEPGIHVRVHEYPQGFFGQGLPGKGFLALLQIDADSMVTRAEVDETFRRLLNEIAATETNEIEPYD